jgi:hypothetical protein
MISKENIVSVTKNYDDINVNNFNFKVIFNTDKICFVPLDPANSDYQAIQEWIAEGNTVIDNGGNS